MVPFGVWLLASLGAAVRPSSIDVSGDHLVQRLWPRPRHVEPLGLGPVAVDHERHQFQAVGCGSSPLAGCHVLSSAFKRYKVLFFPHHADLDSYSLLETGSNSSHLRARRRQLRDVSITKVQVEDLAAELSLGVDESYDLEVSEEGVVISSETTWGALRALESLSQLIDFNFTEESYFVESPCRIQDSPRFPHRGLLIDTARHFLTVPRLKRTITAMSFAKLNVLHWHLTEDESFSMPSRSHPELAEKGAWSATERYTWKDVKDVVDFAYLRGIRVIPEFDMPGHVSSWSKSHPELFDAACLARSRRLAFKPTQETFDFLEGLLREWTSGIFRDGYLHLGSDEVPMECWAHLEVTDERGRSVRGPHRLFSLFVGAIFQRAKKLNRQAIFWDEAFSSASLPEDAVIQVWRDKNLVRQVVNAGHRAVLSWGWYLDHLQEGWKGMYQNDPTSGVPNDQHHLVLGGLSSKLEGEACMWGETVDGSDQGNTLWPRLAAVAERLWSRREVTLTAEAARPRLETFRCLLLQRGVEAAPVSGTGRSAPPGPGACTQRAGNWGLLA
ncbi:unnamed protein product [Effrenium voratum]|uniref:Beta-hexosaminidase n=1 Tax=Effrenium voratum TaxID=2562239 RepID=A0AA36N5C9_9DINO|nr:unnamed protein product [Effrenium voratum]CAJ1417858.1 unnamed protein product [Effrenium voratum]